MSKTHLNKKFSIILYQDNDTPKYFEIKRDHFKLIVMVLPLIALISLIIVIVGLLYLKQIRSLAERKEPQVITNLREKNDKLFSKQIELKTLNKKLQKKLNADPVSNLASLSLFRSVKGQEDKTHSPLISISRLKITQNNNELSVSFMLENLTTNNKKLAGHVFVILKNKNTVKFYPYIAMPEDDIQLIFNKGEYFAFSRFRPVKAKFKETSQDSNLIIKILIFSRTGDLIHKKMISSKKA